MPTRSLSSPVLKWTAAEAVLQAAAWASAQAGQRGELVCLGVFGSYARGDAGVGSDLDLVAVVAASDRAFERRGAEWDVSRLPVPAEIVIYTQAEWDRLLAEGNLFVAAVARDARWLVGAPRIA